MEGTASRYRKDLRDEAHGASAAGSVALAVPLLPAASWGAGARNHRVSADSSETKSSIEESLAVRGVLIIRLLKHNSSRSGSKNQNCVA